MYTWQTPVQYIKSIGPSKAEELRSVGIKTVGDLLEYQPLSYIYPGETSISDLKEGCTAIIKVKIIRLERLPGRVARITALLKDDTGTCQAIWYNMPHIGNYLRPGMTATFWGKYKSGILQQPKFSTCGLGSDVVGGQYGVHHKTIRAALGGVMQHIIDAPCWPLPNMVDRSEAFTNLHRPQSKTHLQQAYERLKFDELLMMQLALLKRRQRNKGAFPCIEWDMLYDDYLLQEYFPHTLTDEQYQTIRNIVDDMTGCYDKPMSRLIHGEVGSGKTYCAFYAAMLTALNHKQALILCPTTILAQQHYDNLKEMGWDDVWLYGTGGTPPTPKITIGTHAILNNPMVLREASLVIVDEFHKFGVEQRAKLQKFGNPHILLLSATPIPRTLAASVFGDLDVSTIRELPIKRGTVITRQVLV